MQRVPVILLVLIFFSISVPVVTDAVPDQIPGARITINPALFCGNIPPADYLRASISSEHLMSQFSSSPVLVHVYNSTWQDVASAKVTFGGHDISFLGPDRCSTDSLGMCQATFGPAPSGLYSFDVYVIHSCYPDPVQVSQEIRVAKPATITAINPAVARGMPIFLDITGESGLDYYLYINKADMTPGTTYPVTSDLPPYIDAGDQARRLIGWSIGSWLVADYVGAVAFVDMHDREVVRVRFDTSTTTDTAALEKTYTFTVVELLGDYRTDTANVLVARPVQAHFTAGQVTGSAPFTARFTDTSAGSPDGWSWDFGDGNPASILQNPVHTYTAPGVYSVALTATRSLTQDSNTDTQRDYITATVNTSARTPQEIPPPAVTSGAVTTHSTTAPPGPPLPTAAVTPQQSLSPEVTKDMSWEGEEVEKSRTALEYNRRVAEENMIKIGVVFAAIGAGVVLFWGLRKKHSKK
jgi:PKD repeat protein